MPGRSSTDRASSPSKASSTAVSALLEILCRRYGERFGEFVFTPEDALADQVRISVDDPVVYAGDSGLLLREGSSIQSFAPVSGGCELWEHTPRTGRGGRECHPLPSLEVI
jgi:hypothetical protein